MLMFGTGLTRKFDGDLANVKVWHRSPHQFDGDLANVKVCHRSHTYA